MWLYVIIVMYAIYSFLRLCVSNINLYLVQFDPSLQAEADERPQVFTTPSHLAVFVLGHASLPNQTTDLIDYSPCVTYTVLTIIKRHVAI